MAIIATTLILLWSLVLLVLFKEVRWQMKAQKHLFERKIAPIELSHPGLQLSIPTAEGIPNLSLFMGQGSCQNLEVIIVKFHQEIVIAIPFFI